MKASALTGSGTPKNSSHYYEAGNDCTNNSQTISYFRPKARNLFSSRRLNRNSWSIPRQLSIQWEVVGAFHILTFMPPRGSPKKTKLRRKTHQPKHITNSLPQLSREYTILFKIITFLIRKQTCKQLIYVTVIAKHLQIFPRGFFSVAAFCNKNKETVTVMQINSTDP